MDRFNNCLLIPINFFVVFWDYFILFSFLQSPAQEEKSVDQKRN